MVVFQIKDNGNCIYRGNNNKLLSYINVLIYNFVVWTKVLTGLLVKKKP
jgi:hypothetical protein